jgi:hypothetical protein
LDGNVKGKFVRPEARFIVVNQRDDALGRDLEQIFCDGFGTVGQIDPAAMDRDVEAVDHAGVTENSVIAKRDRKIMPLSLVLSLALFWVIAILRSAVNAGRGLGCGGKFAGYGLAAATPV